MGKVFNSCLKLDRMVFDRILFERTGFSSESDFQFKLESSVYKQEHNELYRVTLVLFGEKQDEYKVEISITGFFYFESDETVSTKIKDSLISKNTISILMPYLRSELSLLTAQPEVESIVLQPFNVNAMMNENN